MRFYLFLPNLHFHVFGGWVECQMFNTPDKVSTFSYQIYIFMFLEDGLNVKCFTELVRFFLFPPNLHFHKNLEWWLCCSAAKWRGEGIAPCSQGPTVHIYINAPFLPFHGCWGIKWAAVGLPFFFNLLPFLILSTFS